MCVLTKRQNCSSTSGRRNGGGTAGRGGCAGWPGWLPVFPGATGNVATEDLLYLLDGLGVRHGVDLDAVIKAGEFIGAQLGRPTASRVARALLAQRKMA